MKKFVVQLNDGNFINICADKMDFDGTYITAHRGEALVAVLDISAVLRAHMSEKEVET